MGWSCETVRTPTSRDSRAGNLSREIFGQQKGGSADPPFILISMTVATAPGSDLLPKIPSSKPEALVGWCPAPPCYWPRAETHNCRECARPTQGDSRAL